MKRREFLVGMMAGGAGLAVAAWIPRARALTPKKPQTFSPNAWVSVGEDGRVTVYVAKSEMGQGIHTSLPTLIAEEMDIDLSKVNIETAPADPKFVIPPFPFQLTGGSTSVRGSWGPLREAGAVARAMLVAAAAAQWKCAAEECRVENGEIVCGKERAHYGHFVAAAAQLKPPAEVKLKDPASFKLIGKRTPRVDTPSKVDGSARFGMDVKLPGMLVAVVERCPVFGGKVAKFDGTRAKTVPGVKHVLPISSGVAVVADGYWPAMTGRKALDITWDEGANANVSTPGIWKMYEEAAQKPGATARHDGDAAAALSKAAKRVEAVYTAPYLVHAPMEPLNATAQCQNGECHIWVPTQAQTFAQMAGAKICGLPPEKVHVHTTLLGGGFGRRAEVDFVVEAVELAKATGKPVKVIWSREDEVQHGFYRPLVWTKITAGLDKQGWPVAWQQRIVSPSIFSRVFPTMVKDGIDRSAVEGSGAEMPYGVPNVHVDYVMKETGVPVGFWRSVGHSSNAFMTESFIDELAHAAGKDPFEYRKHLLANKPRERALLEMVADKAGWKKPLPAGQHRGISIHESFGSLVAQVAEVSVDQDKQVRVHRVVCAIDCGPIVNPDTVEAQLQGGIAFGLGAALTSAITIDKGRVQQSNFHDYQVLRLSAMPKVEVHIMPSTAPLGGVGEPGVPPIAPAVANAIFAATKKRVRSLPIALAMK
jgi:isoquinoline 1-oxidoreductase beta subunit